MEQLRVALEILKKYHFWMLVGLIVLITFGTWYTATADRAAAFSTRKASIDSEINSTKAVSTTPDHPSEASIKALELRVTGDLANASEEEKKLAMINSATQSLSYNVTSAASRLFDDQRTSFKLPQIYPDAEAQAGFEKDFWKVWNHKIEDIAKPPADAANLHQFELAKEYRLQYRDKIKDIFPTLFEMIQLRTTDAQKTAVGAGVAHAAAPDAGAGADNGAAKLPPIVDWPDANALIDYFRNWNDYPSTLDVMVAQENVWVYEALLKVIRNTNDADSSPNPRHDSESYVSPDSHKMAPIKEIQALEIGNEAAQSWAACENSVVAFGDNTSGATATASTGSQPGSPQSGATRSSLGFQSATVTGGSESTLLVGRYVDNSGKPLADPTQQPNQEFRMMPINLRVKIEQKAIPRLLAECANSVMRIDVRAVRILEETPPAFAGESQAATSTSLRGPETVGRPEVMARGRRPLTGGSGDNGGEGSVEDESADPTTPPVPVEIQGIIYIYNPPTTPNPSGDSTATAGATPAGPTAPAGPAASPPPGGAPATTAPATPPPARGPAAGAR